MRSRFFSLLLVILCLLTVSMIFSPVKASSTSSIFNTTVAAAIKAPHGTSLLLSAGKSNVVGTLQPDDRVLIMGRVEKAKMLWVRSDVGIGYLPESALQLEGALDSIPAVQGDLPAPTLPPALPVDDPNRYPVLPVVSDFARTVYARGIAAGNNAEKFTKVGDCMTADVHLFLGRFGAKKYHLARYSNLEPLIAYYNQITNDDNSFTAHSQAALTGFNAASVETALWADPAYCRKGETPLACEYRRTKPSIALIMFGTNDVNALSATEFDFYLRLVIYDNLKQGVVPLLSTFPGDPYRVEKTHQFNQIIVQVAHDYDVPVMNLWLALQSLPYHGRNPNSMYLSRLEDTDVSDFSEANLQYGYTMRNLLTLQALDILWRGLIQPSS